MFASISDTIFDDINDSVDFYFFQIELAFFVKMIVATFLILLFDEIIPKAYAGRNSKSFRLL